MIIINVKEEESFVKESISLSLLYKEETKF